uniref:NACHT domain-containing protein n=1 Tax=Desertifilum tharense IPPAS B-1220 TaxID=1781255 RepID=A0ACD5GUS1_9CYAN
MTGLEPVIYTAATQALTRLVVETLGKKSGGKFLGIFSNLSDAAKLAIDNASKKYIQNYTERHGVLKVLGMKEAVDLESIYTSVQLLDEQEICNFETVEALEQAFRKSQRRRFQTEKSGKKTGIEIANQHQYLMVLGSPGAGKSTFLRKMGLEALKSQKGQLKHQCIPVFIELKRFTGNEINIKQEIAQEFDICGFPSAEKFTNQALEQGKLLILLDGLDEVPTQNLNQIVNQIQDFVDRYQKNRFIASCRVAAYRSSFRRFRDVVMADFDDTQIQQFINNWFQSDVDRQTGTAKKCWKTLQKPENTSAKELAYTPLLLTFLCLVYNRAQSFPDNRSILYRKALRILLEEWAAEKRIVQDEIYQGLHTELEEILLSEVAYSGFKTNRLFFSQREIVEQIKTFLSGNLNAPQHLDGKAVLNAITVQQGVLVERAENIYSFSHLTLQEYLTAQYIDDRRLIQQLVTEHLTDQRWKEVFLLVAGLMRGGADELLLLMEQQAQQYTKNPKLQALLNWADRATAGSKSYLKGVAKRAIANAYTYANTYANVIVNAITYTNLNVIANDNADGNMIAFRKGFNKGYTIAKANTNLIFYHNTIAIATIHAPNYSRIYLLTSAYANAYANVHTNAYAIAINSFLNIVQKLEKLPPVFTKVNFPVLTTRLKTLKAKIPDDTQPQEVHSQFAKRLIEIWLQAFHLTPELIDFSPEELEEIDNTYFYINYLIIQCKQSRRASLAPNLGGY